MWGDILRVNKSFEAGTFRTGVWYETSDTDRHQYDLDLTLGVRDPRETKPTPVQSPSVLFDQQSTIRHVPNARPARVQSAVADGFGRERIYTVTGKL